MKKTYCNSCGFAVRLKVTCAVCQKRTQASIEKHPMWSAFMCGLSEFIFAQPYLCVKGYKRK